MFCSACEGNTGTLATVPDHGPYVFCTPCRYDLYPEGWAMPCARCGYGFESHVPFNAPGRKPNVCQGYVFPRGEV
jgi:hypothetical protein